MENSQASALTFLGVSCIGTAVLFAPVFDAPATAADTAHYYVCDKVCADTSNFREGARVAVDRVTRVPAPAENCYWFDSGYEGWILVSDSTYDGLCHTEIDSYMEGHN